MVKKPSKTTYMVRDYQDFTTKDMPEKARRKLDVGDIWANTVQCAKCKDIIRSRNRHDFVWCKCENIFVDGGSWYQRYGGKSLTDVISMIEYYDDVKRNKEREA